ncbi:Nucleotidyltransferase substrate binding protein, HI0074 [Nitrosococcus oceani ATCC 19707]|uniref:Nucleotidyltransferase substrate binding protein, HI0074 n=2 Tax=Nitrosococcus oceani TaxID=1229 RepID=Q3J857_NITOC|nr:nucleotidyltransferase substrate binding protein [Nitrosococcus oceani]ABA58989.1 Nucleotidyltransferase substrate binding protein, HI0074 [Nitrosococcus oceani ATCC 19707]EDZ65360.1 nucleotidyltransferase substrate binding protein, HI0074 family [Nitrosococcus oceani AFC27]KFI18578.1 nucleotidyltransferase [Nitrosococcus oceani C-27]GEM18915.1 nucleotidyltransferase [Nitrosococcus oceani]
MERLRQRIGTARKALSQFEKLANLSQPNNIERDAGIQSFEFSFEAVWKTAQRHLQIIEGIDAASPKTVIRASSQTNLFDEDESRLALQMADDRNLTSPTYNEALAKKIFSRLGAYHKFMGNWLNRMEEKLGKSSVSRA